MFVFHYMVPKNIVIILKTKERTILSPDTNHLMYLVLTLVLWYLSMKCGI